jgi:hypothetical protein
MQPQIGKRGGTPAHLAMVEDASLARPGAEEHVFRDAHVAHQAELLIDRPNAECRRLLVRFSPD